MSDREGWFRTMLVRSTELFAHFRNQRIHAEYLRARYDPYGTRIHDLIVHNLRMASNVEEHLITIRGWYEQVDTYDEITFTQMVRMGNERFNTFSRLATHNP